MDPPDHEDPVFLLDFPDRVCREPAARRGNLARLQRASEGAGQSTGGGRDHVVKGRGVRLECPGRGLVVLGHLVVHPEKNWRGLGWQKRFPQRALDPFDANLRDVCHVAHLPSL